MDVTWNVIYLSQFVILTQFWTWLIDVDVITWWSIFDVIWFKLNELELPDDAVGDVETETTEVQRAVNIQFELQPFADAGRYRLSPN